MTDNLLEPTLRDYLDAASALTDEQMTKDGKPEVYPLNDALNAAGLRDITAAERDAFHAQEKVSASAVTPAEVSVMPGPDTGTRKVRIDESMTDPLPLYIHGVGLFSMRIGQSYDLPPDAISALEHVNGCTFTIIED